MPIRKTQPDSKHFADSIIDWQRGHGRHDLPWQGTRDPYRIWVSEIMLQQTQVSAVIAYYQRFMARFPDVATLAHANLDEVMPYWAGLGYYARCRNLHRAAVMVMDKHGGIFPRHVDDVRALPGIGRSTAAAICAFAYGDSLPILDGNVKRVFARYFGLDGDIRTKPVEDAMWEIAQREVPAANIEAYTQGQMDLGATLCKRSKPACLLCPLQSCCVAYREGRTHLLPYSAKKAANPLRKTTMLVLVHQHQVLLERRPPTGIWGGLWSLPEMAHDSTAAEMLSLVKNRYAAKLKRTRAIEHLPDITHGFTHFTLDITPVLLKVETLLPQVAEAGAMWVDLNDIADAALPAPVKKLLLAL
jgi:A/G-specific adenine glycosylase